MNSRFRKQLLLIALPATMILQALGQGTFQNLDFEQADPIPLVGSPYYPYEVATTNGLPGWTAYIGGNPVDRVLYNDVGLDAPSISLVDSLNPFFQPIQGSYSVYLKWSNPFYPPVYTTAIGQTGQLPNDALSLRFLNSPRGGVLVSFGGQNIPFVQFGTSGNNIIIAGDISRFAGQTGELLFLGNNLLFDDIQFSNQAIPEPSVIGLSLICGLLLGWRRWRNSSRP